MKTLAPSELKTIIHSKRANIFVLEHCRILANGGRVEYLTKQGRKNSYWNIPIANTTALLLGNETSVTQAAMRELAKAGVLVGFTGGGGLPLFSAIERDTDILWFSPQSEYRPTEYLQRWVRFWFDDAERLEAAKQFQRFRSKCIQEHWVCKRVFEQNDFPVDLQRLSSFINAYTQRLEEVQDTESLLLEEARLTKSLYKLAAQAVGYGDFSRAKRGTGVDLANNFLDHGNYLAYGLGAVALWVLGIPHGLAVLHGKTRRGGFVFDAADLVKDAIVLPLAFVSAMQGLGPQEFRQACIDRIAAAGALDVIIDAVKEVAEKVAGESK